MSTSKPKIVYTDWREIFWDIEERAKSKEFASMMGKLQKANEQRIPAEVHYDGERVEIYYAKPATLTHFRDTVDEYEKPNGPPAYFGPAMVILVCALLAGMLTLILSATIGY